ncbi:hypothetical protein TWF694_000226 [Orbilia ellipsospora]|uniref:Fungal N-terminal domain-containing protein n=1 Tax=Orbilia ellipsospora TaxID=2528407 RepID=A0AAV9XNV7_9PEZI
MAFSVSIGDAFLMAQLALKLGRAFTTGRKSAPEEFREVESQLYSISTALSSLAQACKANSIKLGAQANSSLPASLIISRGNTGDDPLVSMLQGCQEILKHLEDVVEKYSSIIQPKDSGAPILRKWSSELNKNWKKVKWTTEGGDLAILRRSLSIHISSLNLALGVISHNKADQLGAQVDQVTIMLTEIHTWFVDNIRDRTHVPASATTLAQGLSALNLNPLTTIHFELCVKSPTGLETICSNASVHPNWGDKEPVFQCRCITQLGSPAPHFIQLDSLRLSPLSFALRRTGAVKTWMIYKASNRAINRLSILVIKGVPAARIHEFETKFIDVLTTNKAKSMLDQNGGTMLAYKTTEKSPSITDSHYNTETRILNLLSDLQQSRGQVEKVTFTINRQSYTREGVENIQLLHYKSSKKEYLPIDQTIYPNDLTPLNTAELIISFTQTPSSIGDITKTILYITYETRITYAPGTSIVVLHNIDCAGLQPKSIDGQESVISGVGVSIYLASPKAAEDLKFRLVEMRIELFVMSLKAPRSNEKLALKLQAKGVHTESVDIADSEIMIVQAENSDRLRLIVTSEDQTTILSQELAEDFMTSADGYQPNFASPTYVVQVSGQGTREISKYDKGFKYFDFEDVYMDRLFGLGLAAFSGSNILPTQISQVTSEPRQR